MSGRPFSQAADTQRNLGKPANGGATAAAPCKAMLNATDTASDSFLCHWGDAPTRCFQHAQTSWGCVEVYSIGPPFHKDIRHSGLLCVLSTHRQNGGATEPGCKMWWLIPTCPFRHHKNLPESQALLGVLCAIALLHIPLATASLWTEGLLQDQRDTTSYHSAWEEQCPGLHWGAQATVILGLSVQLHRASLWTWGCLAPVSCVHIVLERTRGISFKQDHDN